MRPALLIALAAPVAAAWLGLGTDTLGSRRRAQATAMAVGLAAAAALLVWAFAGRIPVAQGFSAGVWSATLAAGVLLGASAIPGLVSDGEPVVAASLLAGSGAAAASVLATNAVTAGLFLAATSAAFAVAAIALGDLRGRRALAGLLVSDGCALVGLLLASRHGLGVPPHGGDLAGFFLLASACLRLGLVPVAGPLDDAFSAAPAMRVFALSCLRAQGFALAFWAVASGGAPARAAAVAGAATAAWGGFRVMRERSLGGAAAAQAGLVVLGASLGGSAGYLGAILLAAAGFLTWPVVLAGGASREIARPAAALLAGGASLPGAVLVVGAAFAAGAASTWYLALAVPALTGALGLVSAGGLIDTEERPAPAAWWAWAALGGGFLLALLPGRALFSYAIPAAASLGAGRLLREAALPALPDRAGIWMVALVLAGLALAAPLPSRSSDARRARPPRWSAWWGTAAPVPSPRSECGRARAERASVRWGRAAGGLGAAVLAAGIWLYVIGAARGFL